jgi:hypothetical protein
MIVDENLANNYLYMGTYIIATLEKMGVEEMDFPINYFVSIAESLKTGHSILQWRHDIENSTIGLKVHYED